MRFRALLISAIMVTTTICSSAALANSTPVSGKTCSRLKQAVVVKGFTLTCIKQGKKMVWSKGVAQASFRQPTPTPTPTVTPTPTAQFSVTPSADLTSASSCKLADQTGTIFNLGFPRRNVVENKSKIRVLAISFAFSDTGSNVIGWQYSKQMLSEVQSYYDMQSYRKTAIDFFTPPVDPVTNEPSVILIPETLADSSLPADQVGVVHKILELTPISWDLGSFDSVLLFSNDSRTLPLFGGQAWQQPPGWMLDPPQIGSFTSPSGSVESLVFSSNHSDIVSHELGHSLFGFIDLYRLPVFDNSVYTQKWDMMDAAYTGDYGLLVWEKWIAGWINDNQIRCLTSPGTTTHFLSFNETNDTSPKLVVIKVNATTAVALEARGIPLKCIYENFCWGGTGQGILAYTVDITKLSAQGAIIMDPYNMAWPNVAGAGSSFTLHGDKIDVLSCNDLGCYVEVRV